jgi:hypothetical protein
VVKRNQVILTWQPPAAVAGFQGVVVTRKRDDSPEAADEIYVGTGNEYTDRGLEYETAYLYQIQARYAEPIWSEPRKARVVTKPRPAGVERVEVGAKRQAVHLRWALPKRESVSQVRLTRLEYNPATHDIVERELLADLGSEYIDRDVEPETSYVYRVCVQTADGHWSSAQEVKARTLPPPQAVTGVKAACTDGTVNLVWQLPDDATIVGTHVVRRLDRPPSDPLDGDVVHHGVGLQVVDTGVEIGHTYCYALFSYDSEEVYSIPVYERVPVYQKLALRIYYPDLDKHIRIQLPAYLTTRQVASHLIAQQGVDLDQVSEWAAVIEETGQVLAPDDSLQVSGVQSGQTVCLTYQLTPAPAAPPMSETEPVGEAEEGKEDEEAS